MLIPQQLTAPERRLWDAIESGVAVSLSNGATNDDRDPENGRKWGRERTVRGEVLAEMLTGSQHHTRRPRAMRLRLARIAGRLDLEALELLCPLDLKECFFDELVNVDEARAPKLELTNCSLPAFTGRQLETRGDVSLAGSHTRTVNLIGAHIGGQLNLSRARLSNPNGLAISANGVEIAGDMACNDDFRAAGEMRLARAHIGGQLNLGGAQLANRSGIALCIDGARIDGDMSCEEAGFQAEGEISVVGAHIGGQLILRSGQLVNPNGSTLVADGARIDGDMFCHEGFRAEGELRLVGARIGGQAVFNQAQLANRWGVALCADGVQVDGDMFFDGDKLGDKRFEAEGELRLLGAHIGGQLSFSGARISNFNNVALNATQARIGEDMFCNKGFHAQGELRLPRLQVEGRLILGEAQLANPGHNALDLCEAKVSHLELPVMESPAGTLNLRDAQVTHLVDCWPTTTYRARIDGMTYETLVPIPDQVDGRLDWLSNAEGHYLPQPYEQLAQVLRRAGRNDDARRVAIKSESKRRPNRSRAGQLASWCLAPTVAYGYKPGRGVLLLGALASVGWVIFAYANAHHAFVPIRDAKQAIPHFHALLYSLNCVLPIVDLGQKNFWAPSGLALGWKAFSVVAGWVLVTLILGAVTSRLVRS